MKEVETTPPSAMVTSLEEETLVAIPDSPQNKQQQATDTDTILYFPHEYNHSSTLVPVSRERAVEEKSFVPNQNVACPSSKKLGLFEDVYMVIQEQQEKQRGVHETNSKKSLWAQLDRIAIILICLLLAILFWVEWGAI
jgi:hypothetical protein